MKHSRGRGSQPSSVVRAKSGSPLLRRERTTPLLLPRPQRRAKRNVLHASLQIYASRAKREIVRSRQNMPKRARGKETLSPPPLSRLQGRRNEIFPTFRQSYRVRLHYCLSTGSGERVRRSVQRRHPLFPPYYERLCVPRALIILLTKRRHRRGGGRAAATLCGSTRSASRRHTLSLSTRSSSPRSAMTCSALRV